jgi:hypothetical protein
LSNPDGVVDLILRGGIVVAISLFIIQRLMERSSKKKESKDRLARVCNTLLIEANDLDEWYKSEGYKELKKSYYEHRMTTTAPFENIINTAPYEGIVNSGLITYLEEKTQKKLNEYYFYATLHNKRVFDLAQIFNDKASSPEIINLEEEQKIKSSTAWQLNVAELVNYEMKIEKLIEELKVLLKEIRNPNLSESTSGED